jgi:hypothetical protein
MRQFAPISSVDFDANRADGQPVGTIAMPVRDHMNTATVYSLFSTDWPEPTDKLFAGGNLLTLQRNTLVQRMRGDWILFIDDDMVWEPDAVKRLVQTKDELEAMGREVDVLGALCFRRAEPHQPTLYVRHESGPYNFLEQWEDDVVEIDGTGMAFALITKRAFERIAGTEQPSYAERIKYDRHPDFFRWQGQMGEDLRFCQDVKAAGGHVYVDTRIRIRHVAERRVGMRDFLRELAERDPEVTAARKEINDEMGLPTVDAESAWKLYHEATRR